MKKSDFRKYPKGSAEHVVLHARWQTSRGRKPSLPFIGVTNPQKALKWAEDMAYFPEGDVYLEGKIPKDYVCTNCGASNCKLWRPYQTMSPRLLCARCAAEDQKIDISDIDINGKRTTDNGRTDQIGWFVPAIPNESNDGYWGYSAVPGPAVDWWKNLQTLAPLPAAVA